MEHYGPNANASLVTLEERDSVHAFVFIFVCVRGEHGDGEAVWETVALLQSDLSRPKGSLVLHRWLGMHPH